MTIKGGKGREKNRVNLGTIKSLGKMGIAENGNFDTFVSLENGNREDAKGCGKHDPPTKLWKRTSFFCHRGAQPIFNVFLPKFVKD